MPDQDVPIAPHPGDRLTAGALRELFGASRLIDGVCDPALADVAAACQVVHVLAGQRLIAQGDRRGACYAVMHGRLRAVQTTVEGERRVLAEIGPGEHAGLLFLLADDAYPCAVHTMRDSTLLRLTPDAFESLAARHPDLVLAFSRVALHNSLRIIEGTGVPSCPVYTVAVVPCGGEPAVAAAIGELVAAARSLRPVAHIDRRRVEAELGTGAVCSDGLPRLIEWLHAQQTARGMVVFECDPGDSLWTRTCLRQADRVLAVASADAVPDAQQVAFVRPHCGTGMRPDFDLLLVHDRDRDLPSGCRRWLDLGDVARLYHARLGRTADFARVVRRLTRCAVGVVLGGGGARGIAHVGVLQALDDAGIPIDVIGGVSMGAIFAAGWARGWAVGEMLDRVRRVFAPKRALLDYTFPLVALVAGGKLERVLRGLYDGIDIEDLWTPFFCASTNISHPGVFLHQRGPLWSAIRASVSLPGVFPPVRRGDQLLVDGGVLDNLPIATMHRACDGGTVIAVDVSDGSLSECDPDYEHRVSGWSLLGRKLNPFAKTRRVPSLVELVAQSTVVASRLTQERAQAQAGLFLRPPVEAFGALQFAAHEALYRIGYEYARERLAGWSPPGVPCASDR